jgi:hypothetical protein
MGMTTFYVQELEAEQAKKAAAAERAAKLEAAKAQKAKDTTQDPARTAPQIEAKNSKQMEA